MRWEDREGSQNIEDRRRFGAKGKSLTGLLITAALVYFLSGGDMSAVLQTVLSQGLPTTQSAKPSAHEERYARFASVVLKDTEDVWSRYFQAMGRTYRPTTLVLYRGGTRSACGYAQKAMGPFYCPRDQKVYLDLSFFDELERNLGAHGDFAKAYVIAHEVGHHVQDELGILDKVHAAQARLPKVQANRVSVRTELQADCLAGVWARWDQKIHNALEPGDVQEALQAAAQVGDDTLQKRAQGYVVPDSFTHGSAKQRSFWFYRGYKSGDIRACDTFNQRIADG